MHSEDLMADTKLQARRITLADGRYLIYYTFSIEPDEPTDTDHAPVKERSEAH